jgi:hypothetical protein
MSNSSTPRVIQLKLDITLDDRKFYNAPTTIPQIAQAVAEAAVTAVNDSAAAVSAKSVDVEWAWMYAWAKGRATIAADVQADYDPEGVPDDGAVQGT